MCIPVHSYSVDTMIQKLQKAVTEYPKNYEVVLSFGRYYVTKEDREQKVPVSNLVDRAAAAQITIKGNYLQHVAVYDESIRKKEADEAMILSEMNHATGKWGISGISAAESKYADREKLSGRKHWYAGASRKGADFSGSFCTCF